MVRETCKEKLDTNIPFSEQPKDQIQGVIQTVLDKFTGLDVSVVKRRISLFLRNHRKSRKKSQIVQQNKCNVTNDDGSHSDEEDNSVSSKSFNVSL